MPNEDPNYLDFYDICPDVHPTCTAEGDMPYWKDEIENLTPALEGKGYIVDRKRFGEPAWYTGEGDSFGPLSRCVHVTTPEGDDKIVVYG